MGFASMDSANRQSKAVILIITWESVDAESQLYALFNVTLHKELKYL